MSRFGRIRRRPDHWPTPHHRARARAAERLDGPLGLTEAQWLDEHLAECSACAAVAAQYDADRSALRAMGETTPEPPRDLWARTAAAIEREAGAPRVSAEAGSRVPVGGRSGRSSRGLAVTALSGVAVAAMVIAVSAVSTGLLDTDGGVAMFDGSTPSSAPGGSDPGVDGTDGPQTAAPQPTPLLANAGNVAWVRQDTNGSLAVADAPVDKVCPVEGRSGCAALEDDDEETIDLSSTPKSVIGSPTDGQAVVISDDGEGGDRLVVLDLPSRSVPPRETPAPGEMPTPTPTPPTDPSESPDASPLGSLPPTMSPEVIPSGSPESTPSGSASAAPTPSDSAETTPSPEATPSVDPIPSDTPQPILTPEPTVAATLALAEDITLVGESAAFSPDGAWFAFTARPTDGSKGPDVYVWRVGDDAAAPLTDDGISTFASWADGSVLVSRPSDPSAVAGTQPLTLAVDPADGTETPIEGATWRPAVSPSGAHAVAWLGTIAFDAEDRTWGPAEGRLELIAWPTDASADDGLELVEGPAADVDIRWDETGEWVGVWVADSLDSDAGRLTLFRVDPERGTLDRLKGAPVEEPALAGFSIGDGRVAWVAPSGADGEGSHIHVAAWVGSDVGTAESVPGQGIVIIR
jgi:hypothetical protein